MNIWGTIMVLSLLGGFAWIALTPALTFKIRIADGMLRVTKGKMTRDQLVQFGEIIREANIRRGWIGGVKRDRRLTLVFSRSIPADCRQQLRNLWTNV